MAELGCCTQCCIKWPCHTPNDRYDSDSSGRISSLALVLAVIGWLVLAVQAACVCLAVREWACIAWLTGSAMCSAVLLVALVLIQLHGLLYTSVLLLFPSSTRRMERHVRSTPRCESMCLYTLPALLLTLLVVLVLLLLAPVPSGGEYIRAYSTRVFADADKPPTRDERVTFAEFTAYFQHAPAGLGVEHTVAAAARGSDGGNGAAAARAQQQRDLSILFETLDGNHDGWLSRSELSSGVVSGIDHQKLRLGSVLSAQLFVSLVSVLLAAWWMREWRYRATKRRLQAREREDSGQDSALLTGFSESGEESHTEEY